MSRTNKPRSGSGRHGSGGHTYRQSRGAKQYYKKEGNSTGRVNVKQRLKTVRNSQFESLYNTILADRMEAIGRLDLAEKIRNHDTPNLPVKLTELWDRWDYD